MGLGVGVGVGVGMGVGVDLGLGLGVGVWVWAWALAWLKAGRHSHRPALTPCCKITTLHHTQACVADNVCLLSLADPTSLARLLI